MEPVRYETRDRVATLTLDRPEALNGIDEAMLAALAARIAEAGDDPSLRALVVTGAGDAFCVGLDIGLLGRAFDDTAYFRDVLERYERVLGALETLPFPVIAAVNGLARAGGFEMILAADLVLVADEARIADHHLAYGILPGGGATARAPRRIGQQRARELILTARWFAGPEAVAIGLALRSVPRASLPAAVEELAARLRPLSRPALAAAKALLRDGADLPLEQAIALEIDRFVAFLDAEPSAREGYSAFVEKREPWWP